jgi:hypothetical protein
VDLGAWLDERYRFPGSSLTQDRGETGDAAAILDGQG